MDNAAPSPTLRVSHRYHRYQLSPGSKPTTAGAHQTGRWWRWRCQITDAHFPPDNLETLEYFPPRTKCRKALRLKRQIIQSTIPFHDIPSNLGVCLCNLCKRSHVAKNCRVEIFSKSSSSFFAPPGAGERPPDLPDRHAHPLSKRPSPAAPNPRRACPKPPPAAAI